MADQYGRPLTPYPGAVPPERVILEIYDAMQQGMDTGESYQTRLDPPTIGSIRSIGSIG